MSKTRRKWEDRVGAEVARVLQPGERVEASGYAFVTAGTGKQMVLGAAAALMTKHYWIALTDRRLILLAMRKVGTRAEFDAAFDHASVRVRKARIGLTGASVELELGGERKQFRFPLQFKGEAQSIALRFPQAAA